MGGLEWIIPIIAIVVWVIANFAKGNEAARKAPLPRQRPLQRPRPVTSDIDRFLEEIQRQRQMQRRQTGEEIPTVQPARAEPRKPTRPRPQRPQPARPRRVREPIPVVRHAIPMEPEVVAEPATPPSKIEPLPAIPTVSRGIALPHLAELRRLISSPHGIRTAFVLSAVLGPPKCRQRASHPRQPVKNGS